MFGNSGKFKTNLLNVYTKVHKLNHLYTPISSSTKHDFFFNEYIVSNLNRVTNHKICTNLHINFKLAFCDFCFLLPFFFLLILFSSGTRFTIAKIRPITWLVIFELMCIHVFIYSKVVCSTEWLSLLEYVWSLSMWLEHVLIISYIP